MFFSMAIEERLEPKKEIIKEGDRLIRITSEGVYHIKVTSLGDNNINYNIDNKLGSIPYDKAIVVTANWEILVGKSARDLYNQHKSLILRSILHS